MGRERGRRHDREGRGDIGKGKLGSFTNASVAVLVEFYLHLHNREVVCAAALVVEGLQLGAGGAEEVTLTDCASTLPAWSICNVIERDVDSSLLVCDVYRSRPGESGGEGQ